MNLTSFLSYDELELDMPVVVTPGTIIHFGDGGEEPIIGAIVGIQRDPVTNRPTAVAVDTTVGAVFFDLATFTVSRVLFGDACGVIGPRGARCNRPAGHREHMHQNIDQHTGATHLWHDPHGEAIDLMAHVREPLVSQYRRQSAPSVHPALTALILTTMADHPARCLDVGTRWECPCGEKGASSREASAGAGARAHIAEKVAEAVALP